MRRHEREITDRAALDTIIRSCRVCRLGLSDAGQPYVVPLSFGYDGTYIYFHAAREGRKIEILKNNDRVCVEFDILDGVITAEQACNWGMRYRSVIGFGIAEIVAEAGAKIAALKCIMGQYGSSDWTFPEKGVAATLVIRVRLETLSGKARL
jgi:nitroimidazol reductase NimA-like FMN-containing flavoprotein (pyridoxamine 5'-phosphate oxidase superfamily)